MINSSVISILKTIPIIPKREHKIGRAKESNHAINQMVKSRLKADLKNKLNNSELIQFKYSIHDVQF